MNACVYSSAICDEMLLVVSYINTVVCKNVRSYYFEPISFVKSGSGVLDSYARSLNVVKCCHSSQCTWG